MKLNAKPLILNTLLTLATLTAPALVPTVYAQQIDEGCSYRDAHLNDGWGYNHTTGESCAPLTQPDDKYLVLNLKGYATGVETSYDTNGDGTPDTTAMCFDAPIINPATGQQIGTGSDCLDVKSNDAGNLHVSGTGFFNLEGGLLVVQGQTTARPVLYPITRDGVNFTHITGANADGGLMYGTGIYENVTGKVRLSGQVDMSRVESESIIYFDCLFIVEFI